MSTPPLFAVNDVVKTYRLPKSGLLGSAPLVTAVDRVTLDIAAGETLALVGESGSGKSTLARLLVALETPDAGAIEFRGERLPSRERRLRAFRREVQIVFQDPYSSLDPRLRVGRAISEPLRALGIDDDPSRRVRELLDAVGLPRSAADLYPYEFSGGQRQRVAIARALAPHPTVLIADEPVSALDVSVQAQILNLLRDLANDFGLTLVLVSHDLAVVQRMADRVAVMLNGRVVELADTGALFADPREPYTQRLLDSALTLTPAIPGP